jgi:hypothetical protein
VTHQIAKTLALTLVLSQLLASHIALAQANLPDNASSTAHKKVADNVDPSVMAEVDRNEGRAESAFRREPKQLSCRLSEQRGNQPFCAALHSCDCCRWKPKTVS